MRYFTRELFCGIQEDSEEASHAWSAARERYSEHFARIQGDLPSSARSAADGSRHDAVIKEVRTSSSGDVDLVLDGSDCPWPEGEIRIALTGVLESEIPEESTGETWLYEEWDAVGPGTFELSVLLDDSELRFVASNITVIVSDYPVRVLEDHTCSANAPPRRCRIVLVDDPDADRSRWVLNDANLTPDTEDEEEGDEVIVRNLLLTVAVEFCPFCGTKLDRA